VSTSSRHKRSRPPGGRGRNDRCRGAIRGRLHRAQRRPARGADAARDPRAGARSPRRGDPARDRQPPWGPPARASQTNPGGSQAPTIDRSSLVASSARRTTHGDGAKLISHDRPPIVVSRLVRLRVRLDHQRLDRVLAAGTDSDATPELALRAAQLSRPVTRRSIAAMLSNILDAANEPPAPSEYQAPDRVVSQSFRCCPDPGRADCTDPPSA